MNKIVHRIMNIIVAAALMLGGYSNVSAAATLATTFNGGFESVVYQYPNAVDNWLAPQPSPPGDRLTRVTSPVRKGSYSLKATIKPGDNYGSSGERAEVYGMYGSSGTQIFENEASGTQFYAISVYLPLDFKSPVSSDRWGIFQQLHGSDKYSAPPVFALGATDAFYMQMYSGDLDALKDPKKSHTVKYPLGALQRGKWVDFVWQIKFAKTYTGTVDIWKRIEGEAIFTKVLSVVDIPTLQFKSSVSSGTVLDAYWKTGYYTSAETFTRVIYIDSNTRGASFNDVVAQAFPTSSATPTSTVASMSTPLPANEASVSTIIIPTSNNVGAIATVNVNLNNILVGGYTSAEFTCTYNPALVEVSNIVVANLFGADPLVAINGFQNGSFILAVAGSNGNRATVSGTTFTFSAKALQAGQAVIECKARISKGDNILVDIPSTGGANLTIGSVPTATLTPAILTTGSAPTTTPTPLPTFTSTPLPATPTLTTLPTGTQTSTPLPTFTPTPLPAPVITGQVLASKLVTIRLYNPDNSLAAVVNTNLDGTFSFTAPAGTYTITATASGFLSALGSITLTNGNTRTISTVTLPAGDIDGNGVIDQFDAMTIGMGYNSANPPAADLNNDGTINVLDLELPAANYRKAGAVAWQ